MTLSSGMEDAHATVLNLDEKTGDEKTSFFAVYDGHGGEFLLGRNDSNRTSACEGLGHN